MDSLKARRYRSLMIEGGSAVISSCLSAPNVSLIDRVIITIAPVFVGTSGMGVTTAGMEEVSCFKSVEGSLTQRQSKRLELLTSSSLGNDIVAAYLVSEVP